MVNIYENIKIDDIIEKRLTVPQNIETSAIVNSLTKWTIDDQNEAPIHIFDSLLQTSAIKIPFLPRKVIPGKIYIREKSGTHEEKNLLRLTGDILESSMKMSEPLTLKGKFIKHHRMEPYIIIHELSYREYNPRIIQE